MPREFLGRNSRRPPTFCSRGRASADRWCDDCAAHDHHHPRCPPASGSGGGCIAAHSFLIDGEAIVTNAKGLAVFDLIRHKRHGAEAVLIAFDLFELAGEDLRRLPIESRKRGLAKLARGPHPGIVLNEFFEGVGDIIFEHACRLGCEGIVSKLNDYRADRHQLDFDGATQSRS